AASEMGVTQERIAWPSRCTVQAPHSAAPQPNLVPVIPSVSRRAQRMGVLGSASTVCSRPLTFSAIMAGRFSVGCPCDIAQTIAKLGEVAARPGGYRVDATPGP